MLLHVMPFVMIHVKYSTEVSMHSGEIRSTVEGGRSDGSNAGPRTDGSVAGPRSVGSNAGVRIAGSVAGPRIDGIKAAAGPRTAGEAAGPRIDGLNATGAGKPGTVWLRATVCWKPTRKQDMLDGSTKRNISP